MDILGMSIPRPSSSSDDDDGVQVPGLDESRKEIHDAITATTASKVKSDGQCNSITASDDKNLLPEREDDVSDGRTSQHQDQSHTVNESTKQAQQLDQSRTSTVSSNHMDGQEDAFDIDVDELMEILDFDGKRLTLWIVIQNHVWWKHRPPSDDESALSSQTSMYGGLWWKCAFKSGHVNKQWFIGRTTVPTYGIESASHQNIDIGRSYYWQLDYLFNSLLWLISKKHKSSAETSKFRLAGSL